MVCQAAESASPGSLLGVEIPGPHPRPTVSEAEVESSSVLANLQMTLVHAKVEEPLQIIEFLNNSLQSSQKSL